MASVFFPYATRETRAKHELLELMARQCDSQDEFNRMVDLVNSMAAERIRELVDLAAGDMLCT